MRKGRSASRRDAHFRGSLAALLRRCDASSGKQGWSSACDVETVEHSGGRDRDHRRHAERRSDVREERRKHRHGQCELRSSGIGYLHHLEERRRRLCERDREVRIDRTLRESLRAWGTLARSRRGTEKCEVYLFSKGCCGSSRWSLRGRGPPWRSSLKICRSNWRN